MTATAKAIFAMAIAAGLTASAAPAAENQPKTDAVAKIIAPTPGEKVCFRRVYEAAHLRAHRKQTVAELTFLLRVVGYSAAGDIMRENPDHIVFNFALSARRRGAQKPMQTAGDCHGADRAACVVDCDGGEAFIEKPASGDGLIMRLEGEGIAFGNDCDSTRGVFLTPGADDKLFELEKAPWDFCAKLEKEMLGE